MKLKESVVVKHLENAIQLCIGSACRPVEEADAYIFLLLEADPVEDCSLIELVAKQESLNEINVGLRLTQLVLDYGEYLAAEREPVFEM